MSTPSQLSPRSHRPVRLVDPVLSRVLGRGLYAMALLTVRAALRYRLVQVLLVLLLGAVVGLPAVIKHDGTAQGFTQILLTYTLGAITVLLGFTTLWLGCGTLARDIEECQMQMVTVKPIPRWQVWVGKWLGITFLNAVLLGVSGVLVYGLLQWRGSHLPAQTQAKLHSEILIARASVKPAIDYAALREEAERQLQERLKDSSVAAMDRGYVRTQVVERVRAQLQVVPPSTIHRWKLDLGFRAGTAGTQPLTVRTKFFAANVPAGATVGGWWEIGPPDGKRYRPEEMSLSPETFHEFTVPPGLLDAQGALTIDFYNFNRTALIFPLEDGLEVLYPEGSFAFSYARGLGVILCWLALLAAVGLATGSFLSFPVAAFCALGILLVSASTSTLRQVVDEGGISGVNPNSGRIEEPLLIDRVAVAFFKGVLWTINLARDFSPIDSLSTGRSVSWGELGRAVLQVIGVMGGLFAGFGIVMFNRRELAAAQGA